MTRMNRFVETHPMCSFEHLLTLGLSQTVE